MNYHDKIISILLKHKNEVSWILNMYNCKFKTNVSLSQEGDIDMLVEGTGINTQNTQVAVIEIKGHKGLINHYKKEQLPKYVRMFPGAKQFVICGTETKSENFRDFKALNILENEEILFNKF